MNSHRASRPVLGVMVLLMLPAVKAAAVPPDGVYTGTTSQGREISLTVAGGTVIHYSIGWACGSSSGTTESDVSCSIGANESFQCGSSSCSFIPFTTRFSIGGTFTGGTVVGSFDFSFYPCVSGCSCCFRNGVTYSASLPFPELSISDCMVTEGDEGTTASQFDVTLAPASDEVVTVDWMTTDGTADSSDYEPSSGSLTFVPGDTNEPIVIQVMGDVDEESDETFFVDLDNPTNANIADGRGQCTIIDDDTVLPEPVTSVLDISNFESIDLLNDADNDVLARELGEGALVTGVGWDVNISTVGASWLSDARMYFDGSDQDGIGLFLTPGIGDDFPGSNHYFSDVIDFSDYDIPDIPILSDGMFFIQFFESFDDNPDSVDAIYEAPSNITIQYFPSPNQIFVDGFESGDTTAWD